jgi:glycerate kinase
VVPRRFLVAPDAFKGTLPASRVAAAIGRGLQRAGEPEPDLCPVADGGEGTQDVLLQALGGLTHTAAASDPLGRPVEATFAVLRDGAAVVEVSAASGLARVASDERDPLAADTRGTGELIAAAVATGAHTVLVAAGGSATTDGGAGAIAAIEAAGGLGDARLVVCCDVRTPFEQAAVRFGPQKGADPAAVRTLARRLERLATRLPRDPRSLPMGGAAGGLAGGLWARYGAELRPAAPFVLDSLRFDERLRGARAVIVGEGRLDATTLEGKAAGEIATRARQIGVPAHAIVGGNALSRFDARILDLQVILEAGDESALAAAGARLAALLAEPAGR